MEYQIITSTEEFQKLRQDWERLEKISPEISFFSTYEYCLTWWEVYEDQNDLSLFIICVFQNNAIVGIAPFLLKRQRSRLLTYNILMFFDSGDYRDCIINPSAGVKPESIYKTIFSAIDEYKHQWDEIQLTHISHKSPLAAYLLKSDLNKHFGYLIENPYVDLSKYNSFDEFATNHLPAKTRQYANRLKKHTAYTFHVTQGDKQKEFAEIHITEKNHLQQQGKTHRHSLFEDSKRSSFIARLFKKQRITSYYLYDTKTSKIIIFNSGYVINNVFYSTTTAFNPQYMNFGAGKVMYYEILNDAFINPLWNILDAGCGRYPWKFEWTSDFNFLYKLHFIKPENKKLIFKRKLGTLKQAIAQLVK